MPTFIFNQSLSLGVIPADWKLANITPIFKKGDHHLPETYRPVSLTSVSCKNLEPIVCRHLIKHLEGKKILTSVQHGFLSDHSCDTQLLVTAQDIFSRYGRYWKSKAFDVVPHQRLLSKLDHYRVRGETHTWIRAILTGRSQRVLVNDELGRPTRHSSWTA